MPALNNVITATITLYKIEEITLYQAEILSSNGNIFHPYDLDTQLNFKVFHNNEDITRQFLDIEWVKFSHDSSQVIEDKEWGTTHYGKDSIIITRDEINKKCIIQANAYMYIKNERTCVASARVTLLDINELYSSTTPPDNPIDGFIWVNTSYNPPGIMSWNAVLNKWVEVGKTTPPVRNILRNSNFWKLNTEYYIEDNSECLEPIRIVEINNKKWAKLKSSKQTVDNISAGLLQDSNYPIVKNSDYSLSFLAYKETTSYTSSNQVYCKIISINNKNENTNLLTTMITISDNKEGQITVPFKTLNDTEKIRCFIGVEPGMFCEFYITQLSLYNTDSYYPWELAPEDVQEQLQNKLDSDHLSVFNALTRNGTMEGMYINTDDEGNEHYYFNASHLKTGSIDGGLINGIGLNIKDEDTGESIFHVYKNETGTHIDIIANNLLIGTSRETASTINYVNSSVKTAEENAISTAETYTNGQIDAVNQIVETKADNSTVTDLEERVAEIESNTEDDAIIGTVTGSATYVQMMSAINNKFNEQDKELESLNKDIQAHVKDVDDNVKPLITEKSIVSTVRNSKDYKDDLNTKVNTDDFDTYKIDYDNVIQGKFSTLTGEVNKKASDERVNGIDTRVKTLEDNTTVSSIVSIVRNSTDYKNDLLAKVNTKDYEDFKKTLDQQFGNVVKTTDVISKINSSAETVKISSNKVDIEFGSNKSPISDIYTTNFYSNNDITLGFATNGTAKNKDEIIDKLHFVENSNGFDLTINIAGIKDTNYVKVSNDTANIYMNNNEIIKLLLYEIKNLKIRVKDLEDKGGE